MDVFVVEKMRVVIRKSPGIDGTDYINASFINVSKVKCVLHTVMLILTCHMYLYEL